LKHHVGKGGRTPRSIRAEKKKGDARRKANGVQREEGAKEDDSADKGKTDIRPNQTGGGEEESTGVKKFYFRKWKRGRGKIDCDQKSEGPGGEDCNGRRAKQGKGGREGGLVGDARQHKV